MAEWLKHISGIEVGLQRCLSCPLLGELDKAGGKLTDKDGRPWTSALFLCCAAELARGRRIESVPLLWSLLVHEAGVVIVRPTSLSVGQSNCVKSET